MANAKVTVFISHTQDDAQWVKDLAESLERKHVQVFLQERDIGPGQIKLSRIEEAIGTAHTAILVLSAAAMADPIVYDEYAALLHEANRRGLRLIPVLHFSASIRVPPFATTRLWADFRELSADEHDAKVTALAAVLHDVEHSVGPHIVGRLAIPVEVLDAARATRRPSSPPPQPAFVVTYAKPDADYGAGLVEWLARSGLPAWSIADLTWGSRWVHEIRQRLRHALAIVVVMSPAAEDSEDVEREILEGQWYGREFFPVLLRGDRNFLLASSWYFDARGDVMPGDAELRRLRRIHQAHLSGRPAAPPGPTTLPVRAPIARTPEGIPLRRLRALLMEREFAHADLWTTSLVLAAARRLDTGWMDRRDAHELPASLLAGIDAAWSEQTDGQQGFQQQLDLHRLTGEGGTDFLDLAEAYGWRTPVATGPRFGERLATRKYHEFVDRSPIPAGLFPTLRNQQIEFYPGWYDRWRSTVIAVHLRLRDWEKEKDH